MKNYYASQYLLCKRAFRECTTIYDFINLADNIGFVLGQLYSSKSDYVAIERISSKFHDLKDDAYLKAFEIFV